MGERAVPEAVEVAAALVENRWNGTVSYEAQAVDFREPGQLLGGVEPFAIPIPFPEALARARMGEGVYVPEDNLEGLAYAQKAGFRLLPPEEASLWLGLPPFPVKVGRVEVALGALLRERLGKPPVLNTGEERLKHLLRRHLLLAYERGHAGLFSEALLAYWEALTPSSALT